MSSQGVPADGGHAQAMRNLQRVNNKNNIQELYLRRRLEGFNREQTHNISLIDKDKYDQYDFLKQIRKCESDLTMEHVKYFGKKSRNKRRDLKTPATPHPTRLPQQPTPSGNRGATNQDKLEDNRGHNKDLPEIMLRNDRRFLSTAPANHNRSEKPSEEAENEHINKRDIGTAPGRTRVGWMEPASDGLAKLSIDDNKTEHSSSRQNNIKSNQNDHLPPIIELADVGDIPPPTNYTSAGFGNEAVMMEVMAMKSPKKRKRRRPFEERLKSFYNNIEDLKVVQAETPPIWQQKRQWKLLTQGIKAALQDSSDDDCDEV
ncbi:unnamed protein product [Owenia fusiformis]|uniref:Uncharacterized protein n=1 Tax=Owenia fusiformis TaxID=6347 RepID=A0A8J1XUM3_OWEFU|nr:unnamed protein product [Owenia fusiformis]